MKTAQQCAVFLFNFSQTNTTPMKYKILTLLLLISVISVAQQNLNLIPKPHSVKIKKGHFVLNKETVILVNENSFEAIFLKESIKSQTGLELKITSKIPDRNVIQLGIQLPDTINFNKERYELNISKNKIQILLRHAKHRKEKQQSQYFIFHWSCVCLAKIK